MSKLSETTICIVMQSHSTFTFGYQHNKPIKSKKTKISERNKRFSGTIIIDKFFVNTVLCEQKRGKKLMINLQICTS